MSHDVRRDVRRLLVIQHDHVSPLGPVAAAFEARGWECVYHLVVPPERFDAPDVPGRFPPLSGVDAVLAMGAPWSVYEIELVGSWVLPEQDLLREADAGGIPVLGICFGGQLLAQTHGGSVSRAPQGEIGWVDISTDEPEIVPPGPWFQWHADRWVVPPDGVELARNEAASQAFSLRRNLGLQFHPEVTVDMLLGWLDNGGDAVLTTEGIDREDLLALTRRLEADAAGRAERLVEGFLHFAGLA